MLQKAVGGRGGGAVHCFLSSKYTENATPTSAGKTQDLFHECLFPEDLLPILTTKGRRCGWPHQVERHCLVPVSWTAVCNGDHTMPSWSTDRSINRVQTFHWKRELHNQYPGKRACLRKVQTPRSSSSVGLPLNPSCLPHTSLSGLSALGKVPQGTSRRNRINLGTACRLPHRSISGPFAFPEKATCTVRHLG